MKPLRNRYFALGDIVLLAGAAYVSFVLRLDRFDLGQFWPGFILFTVLSLVVVPSLLWRAGVYRRYWQYATAEEVLLLLGVTGLGVVVTGVVSRLAAWLIPADVVVPRSIPLIFLLLAVAVTTGQRLAVLLLYRYTRGPRVGVHLLRRRLMPGYRVPPAAGQSPAIPALVVGAGAAGSMIVRELQENPQIGLHIVGFLDDDLTKQRLYIHGTPVLGTRHDLPRVVGEFNVQQVIIAMPTAAGKVIREIVDACEEIDVRTRIIPGIYELLGGTVSVSQLRDVQVEDLLRREPVWTDTSAVRQMVAGKSVLVTGAGGSIGSELCRQVLGLGPRKLILLGHGENSIFEIDNELRRMIARLKDQGTLPSPAIEVVPVIADIRHAEHINLVMSEHRPQIVFHAAAHKHVPLMELNPAEAVSNNVTGTRVVLDAATTCGVERFVLISTDKAVNPTSLMGATKRVAEQLVHRAALETRRPYVAVRFGNVLGSRGSVVLTFKQQIASGGPVTVTHPEMMRFFMTIPEAVQLVLQAAALGKGGEVFMLDMGEPVKIEDLARDLIELSGLQLGRDIDIVYTGSRPGEKLHEELFVRGEKYQRTAHEKVYIVEGARNTPPRGLLHDASELQELASLHDNEGIVATLRRMLPHYRPQARIEPPNGRRYPLSNGHQDGGPFGGRNGARHSSSSAEPKSAEPDRVIPALQTEDSGIAQV